MLLVKGAKAYLGVLYHGIVQCTLHQGGGTGDRAGRYEPAKQTGDHMVGLSQLARLKLSQLGRGPVRRGLGCYPSSHETKPGRLYMSTVKLWRPCSAAAPCNNATNAMPQQASISQAQAAQNDREYRADHGFHQVWFVAASKMLLIMVVILGRRGSRRAGGSAATVPGPGNMFRNSCHGAEPQKHCDNWSPCRWGVRDELRLRRPSPRVARPRD
jgi:hypothetical protein